MSYPFGVTTRTIDSLCPSGRLPGQETCAACKREMVERWTEMWFVGDDRMDGEPLPAPGKQFVCSTRCLSQIVYDTAPEPVQDLMRIMARITYEWTDKVRFRRMDGQDNLDWELRHCHIALLLPRDAREVMDDAVRDFLQVFIGRDCAIGSEDFPQWYEDAITPAGNARLAQVIGGVRFASALEPAEPVEFVHLGIGGAR